MLMVLKNVLKPRLILKNSPSLNFKIFLTINEEKTLVLVINVHKLSIFTHREEKLALLIK